MRVVVGTMTGTSMDAVDAVTVEIVGHGLEMQTSFHSMASTPIGEIQNELKELSCQSMPQYDRDLALQVGQVTAKTIQKLNLTGIDLIALHGQTIYHKPPTSIQLIDPTPIIKQFECTVLNDPRQADLTLGGQGAPITPLADWVMFRSLKQSTAIVNLGGFCNITLIPADCEIDEIRGCDVCCCNLILDAIARDRLDTPFDEGGEHACNGTVDNEFASWLTYQLQTQQDSGQSLGTGDDLGTPVIQQGKHLQTSDLLATVTHAIGSVISNATNEFERVLIAGGGAQNKALQNSIKHDGLIDEAGVPLQAREGMAMAILGALSTDGISITLSQVTGRRESTDVVGFVQASP